MDPDKEKKVEEVRDPLLEFADIDDEEARLSPLPDAELNPEPPPDPEKRERNADGTFKGEKKDPPDDPKAKKPDEKKPDEKAEKKDESVPLAKFLDEKAKLKAELEQRDITIKEFQKKLEALEAKLPKPQAEPEPDYIEDPKGYVDTKLAKALSTLEEANKKIAEQGKEASETANRARETAELHSFMQNLQNHEARFVAQNPDYPEALAHMRQIRAFQLQQFNPNITDEQIHQVISQEEISLAVQLTRAGRDPVATAFELAKKYGYVPKKPDNGDEHLKLLKKSLSSLDDPSKRLPPDQSLGASSGATDLKDDSDQVTDAVDLALASLKRARA